MNDLNKELIQKVFGGWPEIPEIYMKAVEYYNPLTTDHDVIPYVWMALYTEDEARMLYALPGSVDEVAERTGFDKAYVAKSLKTLADDGKLMYTPTGFTRLPPNMTLTLDFLYFAQEGKRTPYTKEQLEAMHLTKSAQRSRVGMPPEQQIKLQMRIIPKYDSIKNVPGVMPCENIKELLCSQAAQGTLASERCTCKIMSSKWNKGEYPADGDDNPEYLQEGSGCESGHCFQLASNGMYFIRFLNSYAPSVEEAAKKVEEMEKTTTIYVGADGRIPTNICCCHFDYCFPKEMEAWAYKPSRFRPSRREAKCLECGKCVNICQFKAIDTQTLAIDPEKCKGCGNCVTKCPGKALKMEIVHPVDWIPDAYLDMKELKS